jgi:hypothetical protein
LQHSRVRPLSGARSLPMASSLGFGPNVANFYGLPAPTELKLASHVSLLAHYAKGTLSPKLQLLAPAPGFDRRGGPRRNAFPHGTVRYRPQRLGFGGRLPHLRPPLTSAAYCKVCGVASRRPKPLDPRLLCLAIFQRQVPLPLPCVNFAQIAHPAIPAAPASGRGLGSRQAHFSSVMGGVCRA